MYNNVFRSIALLMQIALPCAFFAPAPITLILLGGTDAMMAPPIDYMKMVSHFPF